MKTIGLKTNRMELENNFIWNFFRDIRVNDEGLQVMASSNGSRMNEEDDHLRHAGICLHLYGENMDIRPTSEKDGFILLCSGDDAVEALKEAVTHLYRVIVKEKVDICEVEASRNNRRKNK